MELQQRGLFFLLILIAFHGRKMGEDRGEMVLNSKTWAQCHDLTPSQAVGAGMMLSTVTEGPG